MGYLDTTHEEAMHTGMRMAILPLGSFEQHGPHLPLNTDNYLTEALARGVAEKLGAFLLPVQPITTCYEHHGKKGSVHFSADIFYRFLIAIVEDLYIRGFNRVAILKGHGGIFVLEPAIRHLNSVYTENLVIAHETYNTQGLKDSPFTDTGIHAGDVETSLMLYLKPELVDMSKAVDCIPEKPRPYLNYGCIFTLSPSGVWGEATAASADKGRRLYEHAVIKTADQINMLFNKLASTDYTGRPAGAGYSPHIGLSGEGM